MPFRIMASSLYVIMRKNLVFDVLMIGFMGKAIQQNFPNKYIYLLYGLGALFGGLSMTVFQRPSPYIHPRIGSESSIAAFITFIGLLNPRQTFVLFVFPMPAWVLLAFLGMYSLIFDPEKKSFAGMTAGLTVYQLMRGKFIWYSLFNYYFYTLLSPFNYHVFMSSFYIITIIFSSFPSFRSD